MTENIDTEEKELPINALRVCEAIAKIGYTPSAALMDLADNSFTASATQIHISLSTVGNYAKKGNVIEYGIMDNGSGMDEVGIENALRLGSDDDYQQDSLSKFGMGLKSAGFSLGAKIVVFSRKDGNATAWELDRDEIERRQAYIIKRALNIDELSEQFNTAFDNETSGTFIQVTKTECNNNESAKKSIEKLTSQLGIVYYEFLKENDRSIEVAATGKPNITISPIDILHKEDATISYNSDQYEGKKPCISYDHELAIGDSEDCPKLRLEISLFPQDGMKSYAAFSEGERKKIASYKVNRKHKGFFIYRNGRLIRWGDNLDGIVSRDRIGFRARLSLNTSHDNYLHVDVSKQHLNISEDILAKVQRACEQSLRWHDEIFSKCTELLRPEEGKSFNERNSDLIEEDPQETSDPTTLEATERVNRTIRETNERIDEEETQAPKEEAEPETLVNEAPSFNKVQYSDRVRSGLLWDSGVDTSDGTFVRINKNHEFYNTILLHLHEDSPERQSIEAIIWCMGAGENITKQRLEDVDFETIDKVIHRVKRTMATNLENWSLENQDLYTDGSE